jgi:hypothetical protein
VVLTSLLVKVIPMAIGIFLMAMDQTLVAACKFLTNQMHFFTDTNPILAYASIGSELKQLQNIGWIASSYLLTITSVQYVYEDFESRK